MKLIALLLLCSSALLSQESFDGHPLVKDSVQLNPKMPTYHIENDSTNSHFQKLTLKVIDRIAYETEAGDILFYVPIGSLSNTRFQYLETLIASWGLESQAERLHEMDKKR